MRRHVQISTGGTKCLNQEHVRKYKNGAAELKDWIQHVIPGSTRKNPSVLWLHRVPVAEAELQQKAAISDARTRAADTLKRRRDERGEDYNRQRAQDASNGSA